MARTMGDVAREASRDPRVTERERVRTPMGEVCMSHAEARQYREALELRALLGLDEEGERHGHGE